MLKAPWVLLVWLPLAFAVLIAGIVIRAGRWPLVASVFAGMAVALFVLGLLVVLTPRLSSAGVSSDRLPGGPTRRQVRRRAAALYAERPSAHPADLAARGRAWYGGGRVRSAGSTPAARAAAWSAWRCRRRGWCGTLCWPRPGRSSSRR